MLLYLKDKLIANIEENKVYDYALLPTLLKDSKDIKSSFDAWIELRCSSDTNVLSRIQKGNTVGHRVNNYQRNKLTNIVSLTDCYWIREESDSVKWEDISPYRNDIYPHSNITPTLYLNGYKPKEWVTKYYFYKKDSNIELEAVKVFNLLGIPCAKLKRVNDNTIKVYNFTNEDVFLEECNKIFTEQPSDIELYALLGDSYISEYLCRVLIRDADWHAGNIGILRSTETGEMISKAPAYDFDHAFEINNIDNILLNDFVKLVKETRFDRYIIIDMCNKIISTDGFKNYIDSAELIISKIRGLLLI